MAKEILPSDLFQKMNYYNTGTDRRTYYVHELDTEYVYPELIAPDEIFLPVTHYVVHNVYFRRYLVSNYGRIYDTFKCYFVKQTNFRGYLSVTLYCNSLNGICGYEGVRVHRLVMLVFAYNPNYMNLEVNHLNGNHFDNRLCNLEWCTMQENMDYAVEHRQMASGERAHNITTTEKQAREVCERLEKGERLVDIAAATGINYDRIKDIKRGVSWRYLSKEYNIPPTTPRNADLPPETVLEIAKRLGNGERIKTISDEMGINYSTVKSIKTRESYGSLTKNMYLGEIQHHTKTEPEHVVRICELLEKHKSPSEIIHILHQEFGVIIQYHVIKDIRVRKNYTEISKDYIW